MASVLLIGNFLSGSQRNRAVCEDLAPRLASVGWRVLTTSRQPARARRLIDMAWTVWRRRHEYDVAQVDVFSGRAFLWAEIVCDLLRWLDKPYVLTLHGGDLPVFAQRWPTRVHRLLRAADVVTTPSAYLREQMAGYRSDLELQPNALDLGAYTFRRRRQLSPRLVWVRGFHRIYNPSLAPKVIARLVHDHPDVHLTMIGPDLGDGSLKDMQRTAAALDIADRIACTGAVPKADVGRWLEAADIFVSTTNVDNAPVSVVEAMASGLCVVSPRVGGIPYLLTHETDSLLVPPDDPPAMADAIHRLLTDATLADRVSCNGRLKAEPFDWSVVLPQWHRRLEATAARRARPRGPARLIDPPQTV